VSQIPGIVKMEDGLFNLCRKQIENDSEFKEKTNFTQTNAISAPVFQAYRLFKLKRILLYVYDNSIFYRDLFNKNGLKPEDVQSIQDLSKIPFTNPRDLVAKEYDFLCISQGKIEKVITFTSSGTIGPKKRVFFTESDIEKMTDFMGVGMNTVTGPEGFVQILLPGGPVMGQSDLLAKGVQKMGARSVHTGMFIPSEEQIKAIIEHGSTVIFGETRLIYRITKETEDKYDLSKLGVKTLFVTTSYLSDVIRENLRKAWNCEIVTHYGLTEMGLGLAVDCPHGEGYHYNELDTIAEVINPETGAVLPDGEEGELVFTSISREGMPFIRYRTHDIARFISKPCKCGSHLKTISHVNRRLESLVEINEGVNIYPTLFDDIMFKFPEVVDYEIYVKKEDNKQFILFEVEAIKEKNGLKEKIAEGLLNIEAISKYFGVPGIKLVPPGALKGGIHFKKLIKVTH
jgi:phenylacetate-CoA ligase